MEENLAFNLAKSLNLEFLRIDQRVFSDGEVLPKLEKEIKMDEAILILNKKQEENINTYLIKFLLVLRKIRELSKKTIAIMPYFPYARQDAVFLEGEPLSGMYLAELIEKIADIFITINLHEHRKNITDLFKIPAFNLSLFQELANFFSNFDYKNTVVVGPDREAKKFIDDFTRELNFEKFVFLKQRDAKTGEINFVEPEFNFENKEVIIVDDILSSGKTLFQVASIIKEKKAKSISFAFVHLIHNEGIELLKILSPKEIITTNTLENNFYKLDIVKPLSNFLKEKIL